MYAVEIAMRAMAERAGEDPEAWGLVGLVHDFDYERFPNAAHSRHRGAPGRRGADPGRARAARADAARAILGHANYTGVPRDTPMAKALFAVDELCGFLVACALVRPSRSLQDLEVSQRQEEAQGQGVRARREPRGRDAGRRRAGRAARRAHRVRARRASTTRAGPRPRPGVTGAPRPTASAPVGRLRDQPRGRRPTDPGQPGRAADRRPRRLRGDAGPHRRTPPAGSISRTTSSGATPRAGVSPRRWRAGARGRPGARALRRGWARCITSRALWRVPARRGRRGPRLPPALARSTWSPTSPATTASWSWPTAPAR